MAPRGRQEGRGTKSDCSSLNTERDADVQAPQHSRMQPQNEGLIHGGLTYLPSNQPSPTLSDHNNVKASTHHNPMRSHPPRPMM